jgi:hypothetical protein
MAGRDTIPAMLGIGEAVLNRHQQAVIEDLLGDGFLDRLFSTVTRPHYLASGGMVGAANRLDQAHFPYLWGGGHQATPAPFGPMDCSGAVSYVLQQGGVNIPTMTSGMLMNAGKPGGGPVTVFANAGHTFMRIGGRFFGTSGQNPGGGAGWFDAPGSGYLSRFAQRHFTGGEGVGTITAPDVSGSGLLPSIVRATLGAAARGANASVAKRLGSIGGGDAGDPGPTAGSGAGLMRSIASRRGWNFADWWKLDARETGHGANLTNPTSTARLRGQFLSNNWGKYGPGSDPSAHPSMSQQIQAMAQYIADRYGDASKAWAHEQQYGWYSRGGLVQSFAKGGRASKRKKPPRVTASDRARDYIRPLRALQSDRIDVYDADMTAVDDLNIRYGISERIYDLSDEELVRDDGSVDERAVGRRARELAGLASLRARIVERIQDAIKVARRVIKTYTTIIVRLRKSLGHASKKNRAGVKGLISTYEGRLTEWRATLKDLTGDKLPNARLDYRELLKEGSAVLGTKAEPTDTGDTGGGDLGGTDTGGGDTDTTTAPPSALDIAAGAAQEFASYLAGAQDLFRSFGGNYLTRGGALGAGGLLSGAPDVATAVAGLRGFGATGGGSLGGVNGAPVIVVQQGGSFAQFASAPDDGPTFMSQVRFQVESASG